MNMMWFHLIPYTEQPADFRDANPPAWIDSYSSLFDLMRAYHMYNDFVDESGCAATVGFDAIRVNVHHSNGHELTPSPRPPGPTLDLAAA
jgi:hypothetical protein